MKMAEPTEDPGGEEVSRGAPVRQREHSPMLHLDLYNFECPVAEGSRYVLTSPRSLEACARCMVKPVELLSRNLSDLVREAPGRSMRVATGLCEVYEIERQRKLKMCREERERIIRQEKRRILPLVLSSSLSSPSSSKASSRAEPSAPAVGKRYDSPSNTGTQRSNTPLSSSERSKSLPSKSTQRSMPPPSKKQHIPVSKTKKCSTTQSKEYHGSGDSVTKEPSRKSKSQSLDSLQKMRDGSSGRTSSESITSSFSGDSLRGRTTQFIPKSRTLDAVNSLLGRSFSLGDLSHSPQTTKKVEKMVKEVKKKGIHELPQRDKKIAAIMIARHEEENIRNEQSYWAHLQWDTQRRTSGFQKEQEERQRQKAILQGQKMLESQIKSRRGKISMEELNSAAINQSKSLLHEAHLREQGPELEKHNKEESGKKQGKQKKTHQEQSLKSKNLSDELSQDKLLIAQQKKQEVSTQLQVNKILQNKMEKIKHQVLLHEIAQKEESDHEELRRTLERNLYRAQEKVEQLQEKKNQELKSRAQKEEMQTQRARQVAERKERERSDHLKELAVTTERRLQHASQIAEEVVQHKAKKAIESRLEKEKIQRENRQRVLKSEDMKRQELLMSIEKKLERSEQIFREKQTVLDNARSVARASFNIRERVRAETNIRTFDKMALEAELYANINKK
ncbi:PREDICTED: coiled-coil domain-containing protein 177 [Nanorana parkeri]|uniref:coiled-coil domain-containing protein 177 n=1 Tax=Nanorana parkeri TaxID=125878 RepID=UPI000855050A|nr:PREDICTED: coiled-coil domain-containing protein 177 [Nanorana parkeri]